MSERCTGIVKWFDGKKGYGFIVGGETQFFAHFKEIGMKGFKNLIAGESVEFDADEGPKGPIAKNIRPKQFLDNDSVGNHKP